MVLLCACAKKQPVQAVPEPKPLSCVTQDGAISFVFGADWTQDAQSYAYDLLCYAKTRDLAAGVFSYTRAGAAQAFDPAQALDFHVKDFAGKRENARILEEHTVREDDGHRYTTVLLAAESDGEKLAYYFTLIEFAGYSDAFAVLVQAAPQNISANAGRNLTRSPRRPLWWSSRKCRSPAFRSDSDGM